MQTEIASQKTNDNHDLIDGRVLFRNKYKELFSSIFDGGEEVGLRKWDGFMHGELAYRKQQTPNV